MSAHWWLLLLAIPYGWLFWFVHVMTPACRWCNDTGYINPVSCSDPFTGPCEHCERGR